MNVAYLIKGVSPHYVLDGWHETEYGTCFVHYTGDSLEDCVRKVMREHPDFGETDLEVSGGYISAEYDVTQDTYKMVEHIWVRRMNDDS